MLYIYLYLYIRIKPIGQSPVRPVISNPSTHRKAIQQPEAQSERRSNSPAPVSTYYETLPPAMVRCPGLPGLGFKSLGPRSLRVQATACTASQATASTQAYSLHS